TGSNEGGGFGGTIAPGTPAPDGTTGGTIAPERTLSSTAQTLAPGTSWTRDDYTAPGPVTTQEFVPPPLPGRRLGFGLVVGILFGLLGLALGGTAIGLVVYANMKET